MGRTDGGVWVGEVINKEPVLSEAPKCVAKGCWHGIIENDHETVGLCPKCLGTGVAHFRYENLLCAQNDV